MGSLLLRVALGAGLAAATTIHHPSIAEAQPAPTAQQQAKKLVDDANAAFAAKDYDRAIDLYQQAHNLVSHPLLLFNIAQSHRLAGRPERAAPFYERYLQLAPNGPEAGPARAALAEIKAAAAKQGSPSPGGTTTQPEVTQPGDPGEPTTAAPRPEGPPDGAGSGARAPVPEEPLRTDTVARPGQSMRTAGIVIGGIGLVSTVFGVYFTTRVLAAEDEAERLAMMGASLDDVKVRGESAQRKGDIAYIVGGALIVGGAVTYFLGHRKGRDVPTTAVMPIIGPDFAGVAFSGSLP